MPNSFGDKTFQEVVSELQQLNPKANITINASGDGIVSSCPVVKLHLPREFYVTKSNSLSNLGHTASGNHLYIGVEVKNAELVTRPKKLRRLNILGSLKQTLLAPKNKSNRENNQNEREL